MNCRERAFSLIEILAAVAIVSTLAVLAVGAVSGLRSQADRADALTRLRTLGQAIHRHVGDHDGALPGPLWPGQVLEYDPQRDGRLVRELADYLGIERRETSYVVESMIPRAVRRNPPAGALRDLRVYVMNAELTVDDETHRPFGSLTVTPPVSPMKLAALPSLPPEERWMVSEADQLHPAVAGASWKAHTAPAPVHGTVRAALRFDGSAGWEKAP